MARCAFVHPCHPSTNVIDQHLVSIAPSGPRFCSKHAKDLGSLRSDRMIGAIYLRRPNAVITHFEIVAVGVIVNVLCLRIQLDNVMRVFNYIFEGVK